LSEKSIFRGIEEPAVVCRYVELFLRIAEGFTTIVYEAEQVLESLPVSGSDRQHTLALIHLFGDLLLQLPKTHLLVVFVVSIEELPALCVEDEKHSVEQAHGVILHISYVFQRMGKRVGLLCKKANSEDLHCFIDILLQIVSNLLGVCRALFSYSIQERCAERDLGEGFQPKE